MSAEQGAIEAASVGSIPAPAGSAVRGLAFPGERSWARKQPVIVGVLVLSDLLLALATWQVAVSVQGIWGNGQLSSLAGATVLPIAAVWIGLRALLGLYPGYGLGQVEELRRQTFALLTALAIAAVFALASQFGDHLSRLLVFGWVVGLLLLAPFVRNFTKWALMKADLWGKPVVVFGAGGAGMQVLRVLCREWQLGLKPIGLFDNHPPGEDEVLGRVHYGGKVVDALFLASEHGLDTAIFAMPRTRREHLARLTNLASVSFRHIVVIPNLEGITNSAVVARDLGGTFGVEIKHNLLNPWAQRLKRVIDVVATAVGGVFVLPVIAALYVLVRLESGGPVFYKDHRMGRNGKPFSCIKFRTMVPDAEEQLLRLLEDDALAREEYARYHKLRDDPRVTRVGRFLRKTSLDELPQLWNVIRGEMSLVGPRPYLPRESDDIGETQAEILRVTPGITGPWQVSGRNRASFLQRVRMDAHYVHDWSVWLDLIILVRTVRCLLVSRDAY
jgi:Undecaprenyl-phosphate galactose phosphotransferase WbaP